MAEFWVWALVALTFGSILATAIVIAIRGWR